MSLRYVVPSIVVFVRRLIQAAVSVRFKEAVGDSRLRHVAAVWRTRQNIPYICIVVDSGLFLFSPLYENMTSSTKPEVHNISQLFSQEDRATVTVRDGQETLKPQTRPRRDVCRSRDVTETLGLGLHVIMIAVVTLFIFTSFNNNKSVSNTLTYSIFVLTLQ